MKKFLLSITLLFTFFSVFSTTYYISPNGNDATGNGSLASPWRTLAKATASASAPGDIIHVLAGTYTETQTSSLKVGVNIEGDGIDVAIIKSSITAQNQEFLSLSSPQNTNGNNSVSGFTIDGQYVSETNYKTWAGIWVSGRSNVLIHDMKIVNFYWTGCIFDGFDATSPSKDPGASATGNKFYNNVVLNSSTVGYNQSGHGCLMIGGQTGMIIDGNTIDNDQGKRPALKSGWPIKYWDNGFLKGCKITNNILKKPPYQASGWGQGGDWDFCVELFNVSGLEFAGNTVQGAADINYNYKGSYDYSLWIHDNTFNHVVPNYNHPESAIILEFKAESVKIENNIINNAFVGVSYNTRGPGDHGGYTYDCGSGGCSAITDNIIRNNLFTNIYAAPYGSSGGVIVQSEGTNDPYISNLQIYNNTFVAKSTQGSYVGLDFTSQSNGTIAGVTIKNNIFQGFGLGAVTGGQAKTQSGVSITNNDYYLTNTPAWTGPGVSITNNLNLNPQFDGTYHTTNSTLIAANIGWGGSTNPPPPCQSYSFGQWSACSGGFQNRSYTGSPLGCTGTPPQDSILRSCTAANQPPLANAGPDKTVVLPANSVTLTGSGTDNDGTIQSYQWKLSAAVVGNSAQLALTNLVKGEYDYSLTVTDNLGAVSVPDIAHVSVTDPVIATTVNIGPDQTYTVTLAITASTTGNIVSYAWSKVSGPSAAPIFTPNNAVSTTITNLRRGTYVFRLTVTDNTGKKVSDDKTVTIQ